jgi:tetratricopeptide (TPR) repeat protein
MANAAAESPDAGAAAAPAPAEAAVPSENWRSWRNLWQMPAILGSVALIVAGISVAVSRAPQNDFDGALDEVDGYLAAGRLDDAATRLTTGVQPYLSLATREQRARFMATAADWVALSQAASGADQFENNRRIDEAYAEANSLGLRLDPTRTERWAGALISLGQIEGARQRLAELETQMLAGGEDVRARRNRVLRRLVEASLRHPDLSYDSMMEALGHYRADDMLSIADELWAVARQAELRLEAGHTQAAVERLLIDMRRLEQQVTPHDDVNFSELYTLLGRGYFELGDYEQAAFQLEEALQGFSGPEPARGDALALLGTIAASAGDLEGALERFDVVVRDFVGTRSYLPGLLGRAEVRGMLGDHQRSLEDYDLLTELLPEAGSRRDMTADRLAQSLCDRHDAVLTMGKLDLALSFAMTAQRLFTDGRLPADVLFRVASTSRQIADNLIAGARMEAGPGAEPAAGHGTPAGGEGGGASPIVRAGDIDAIDPAVRREANINYKRAGDFYLQHARALAGEPQQDDAWAESLWMAADSYDLAGWHDLAIAHFDEYVAACSEVDPRRPEALFRLAQAYHADLQYDAASARYEAAIEQHPRSPFASFSHVPLARCYIALGRRPEAERQLQTVLAGDRFLTPDALEYRDAVIELGTLHHDAGDYVRAIEELDKAARRYADDPRIIEVLFRLADSRRGHALALAAEMDDPMLAASRRQQLDDSRRESLRLAMNAFADVCRRYEELGTSRLSPIEADFLRHAWLYGADCAYYAGDYEAAVDRYDQVARRYAGHHSSMTALIQIVNCYHRMDDAERARAAHQRALVRLRQLPDEAFLAPDALLDREAWETWLRNSPLEPQRTASAASAQP